MARPSRLAVAKGEIIRAFSVAPQTTYSRAQLASVLAQNRKLWQLANHTTAADFISFLTKQGKLKPVVLRSETYNREIYRYSWGRISPLELAMSIKHGAYFCHSTAAMLHDLATPDFRMIYLNVEQSPKPTGKSLLTQEGINRAFASAQRSSNLIYIHDKTSIVIISGKNTKRESVIPVTGPKSEIVSCTNLERTLIDIVVRPAYAGGISQLLKAYRAARERASASAILSILKKMDYSYPFHQPIGFLMEIAGYPPQDYEQFREMGLNYDFYLSHKMEHPKYSKKWRLFYPKELHA